MRSDRAIAMKKDVAALLMLPKKTLVIAAIGIVYDVKSCRFDALMAVDVCRRKRKILR